MGFATAFPVALVVAALSLSETRAQTDAGQARFPLFETGKTGGPRTRFVWSPGVRRAPAFLNALKSKAAADLETFVRDGKDPRHSDAEFTVYEQERVATDRFESVVVTTHSDFAPRNFDLALGREIGWSDFLDDVSAEAAGVKAVYDYAARALGPNFRPKKPKGADKNAASDYQERAELADWLKPAVDSLPAFALVPAKNGHDIAGLSLFFGKRTPFGVKDWQSGDKGSEYFLPAAVLKPHLAAAYRDLFGGEAALFDLTQRERVDFNNNISGSSAVLLTRDEKPGKTITLRAEAPASFFNKDEIGVVLDDEAPSTRGGDMHAAVAVGHAVADARPSGVGFDLRTFSVTVNYKVDPFAAVCRGGVWHIRPAPGSPAALAHLPEIDMYYPLKFDCGDYEG
jgi:hypothetical protein